MIDLVVMEPEEAGVVAVEEEEAEEEEEAAEMVDLTMIQITIVVLAEVGAVVVEQLAAA